MNELFNFDYSSTPGIVRFDNYDEIKTLLNNRIDIYNRTDYSTQSLDDITSDRDALKEIKSDITDFRKKLIESYDAPLDDVKNKLDDLIAIVDKPLKKLDVLVKEAAKKAKHDEIMDYARKQSVSLGAYADKILNSSSFFDKDWLLTKYSKKKWQEAVDDIFTRAKQDIKSISEIGGDNKNIMLARYYDTLSMDGMSDFVKNVSSDITDDTSDSVDDGVVGYKVIKVYGTEHQMMQLFMDMELLSIDYEEIEDGMPQDMVELTDPGFDSFVAFDIEHTGTNGSERGDAPAEIIEIGAVRVVNGEVVETFDELANPGRKIVPLVARLTRITDDMVRDMPPVDEVIKRFRDFAGDSVLVGHNITGCDIPHIQKAAKRCGFVFENNYLDTKKLAMKQKKKFGWDNVKLTTLTEYFGIEQKDAHRAWCDAEANAYVYLRLREV